MASYASTSASRRIVRMASFVTSSVSVLIRGGRGYHLWVLALIVVIANGVFAYREQLVHGLITTGMRDPVSWGFYIGNFAYLVGVAAAAVVLVIPAYLYSWKPIKEIVLFGEILAISAIIMCILFVTVDVGRPERIWHMMPIVGKPNFPYSLLVWDIFVLSSYFLLNYSVVTYLLYKGYSGRQYSQRLVLALVFLSIPFAIGIHTVTAFLFMGVKSRSFWHTAILAPRFLASAFCSGPALMVIVFQVVRRASGMPISDAALRKIGELLAYAMAVNLFLLGAEVFTEFYARTAHTVHADVAWFGGHGIWITPFLSWGALLCNSLAFVVFLVPSLRSRLPLLTAACALAAMGVYAEKGPGLLLPGMSPDMRGEFFAYQPSWIELSVGAGIWAFGALLFTAMSRIAIAIDQGVISHATVVGSDPSALGDSS
jgi:molybdopterin-containing oxidoreductase family membrane subunit